MPDYLLAANVPVVLGSFIGYTLAIVALGLYSARYAARNNEDYFLAGRTLSGPVAALSASASSESGWVTLGLVGFAFTDGVKAYWIIPGCLLGFLFNWFVIAGIAGVLLIWLTPPNNIEGEGLIILHSG